MASDARLVGLIREGRSAAFEAAYDRHHRGILSFCRHMLGDADEAEDAVQHTFMAAYNDLVSSDKPIHLRAWLFTIARNRCYTILRARREQPTGELEDTPTEGLAAEVQRRQDLRDLVGDMRRLPDEQRAALVLAEIDALTHAEIAEILGVPREKVKALVFQARESLVASRTARETACADIRQQIVSGRGASLRRANLRRHLRECDGCREFRSQMERQRKQFALLIPVVPGIALKEAVLGAAGAAGGGGLIGGGLAASGVLKTGIAKGLVAAMLAGAGTAGTVVVAATDGHLKAILSFVDGYRHGGAAVRSAAGGRAARSHDAHSATRSGASVTFARQVGVSQSLYRAALGERQSVAAVSRHVAGLGRVVRSARRGHIRTVHTVVVPAAAPATATHPAAPSTAAYTPHATVVAPTGYAGSVPVSQPGAGRSQGTPGNSGSVPGHIKHSVGNDTGVANGLAAGTDNGSGNSKVNNGHATGGGSRGNGGGNGNGNGNAGAGAGSGSGSTSAAGASGNQTTGPTGFGTGSGSGGDQSGQTGSQTGGSGGTDTTGGGRGVETNTPASGN